MKFTNKFGLFGVIGKRGVGFGVVLGVSTIKNWIFLNFFFFFLFNSWNKLFVVGFGVMTTALGVGFGVVGTGVGNWRFFFKKLIK